MKKAIPWIIAGISSAFAAIVTAVWIHTDKCYERAVDYYDDECKENHRLKGELSKLKREMEDLDSNYAVNCCSIKCLAKVLNRHAESIKAAENCFEVFDDDTDHAISIAKEICKKEEKEGS